MSRRFSLGVLRSAPSAALTHEARERKTAFDEYVRRGWVGETDPRTQTASATLDSLSFPAMELYAQPAATATLH